MKARVKGGGGGVVEAKKIEHATYTPGIVNRQPNRTQSVDWVRFSSAIERNRTHTQKIVQSNV